MKITVLDGYTLNPGDLSWEKFKSLGELTLYDRTPNNLIACRIGDAEAIITNKTPLTSETFERCPSIKYVGVLATGYNVVDTVAAREKGIVVTNIPSYGTAAVAQATFALLLEITNQVGLHNESVKRGEWTKGEDFCYWKAPIKELSGKTFGIIGYGKIGKATGQIAKAFGMNVLAYSPRGAGEDYVSLDELLSSSDVISLHCPLNKTSEKLIRWETIRKMKDGVIILNTGRGGLVDENDLSEALESSKVYAAAVDVVSNEPIRADNPLLKAKNCLITPHISWASWESRSRLMDTAAENLKAWMEGKAQNVVN